MTRMVSTRTRLTLLVAAALFPSALVAQTPTPTPTATPTPTPAPVTVVPGSTQLFGAPNAGTYDCSNLVVDTDGSIWTASAGENVVLRLDGDHKKVTRWKFPKDAAPSSLLKDGDVFWITELGGFAVAKFEPRTGALTEWPATTSRPSALVRRPDGAFWLPQTSGVLSKFDPATSTYTYYQATGIVRLSYPYLDADGSLWTGEFAFGYLLRYSPDGSKITRWKLPEPLSYPSKIFRAFDGNLWISLYGTGQLGRFDPATNEIKVYQTSSTGRPYDLKSYRDRIVYTDQSFASTGQVGLFDPAVATPVLTKTLERDELTTTVSTYVATPVTRDPLEGVIEDTVGPDLAPVSGLSSAGVTEMPTGVGGNYGLAVDVARNRIYYSTGGNIGLVGGPSSVSPEERYIPAVASIAGVGGTRWTTQLVYWNRATPDTANNNQLRALGVTQRLIPTDWATGFAPGSNVSVAPNGLLNVEDAVGVSMEAPDNAGGLRLLGGLVAEDLFAWGRVSWRREDGGTFGFARNAAKRDTGLRDGQTGFFFTSPDPSTQRTNGGLLVISPTQGTLSIVDEAGQVRASRSFDYGAGQHVQGSTVFRYLGIDPLPSARVVVSVTKGLVMPFGTAIDTVSSDPMDLPVFGPEQQGTLQWLAGLQRGAGGMGPTSRTDLQVWNGGTAAASLTLYYDGGMPVDSVAAPTKASATVSVPAGRVLSLTDVLGRTLGLTEAQGTLTLVSDVPVAALARVTAETGGGGRVGYSVATVRGGDAVTAGNRGVFVAATDNGWDVMRTDLHLTNVTDQPATVAVKLTNEYGLSAGSLDVTLGAREVRYLESVWYAIAGYGVSYGRIDVVPADGSSPVLATLLRRDNKTLDTDALVPFLLPK